MSGAGLSPADMRRAVALVRSIYERPDGITGCCWHITLDDGNFEDHSVEFCAKQAQLEADPYPAYACGNPWPHADCRELVPLMRQATDEQRKILSPGAHHPLGLVANLIDGFVEPA